MSKEIEKTKGTGLSNAELIDQLRANSGEQEVPEYPFCPIITVDNHMDKKNVEGEEVDVRCKPGFNVLTKEAGEYVVNYLAEKFSGVILLVRYTVENKYDKNNKYGIFRSFEFSAAAFNGAEKVKINVEGAVEGEKEVVELTYADFKENYKDRYDLYVITYTLVGEDIKRFKARGISRSKTWDYLKTFKKPDTISAHFTNFDAVKETEPMAYNRLEITKGKDVVDLIDILDKQNKLRNYFNKFDVKEEKDDVKEGEIVVEDIPFK